LELQEVSVQLEEQVRRELLELESLEQLVLPERLELPVRLVRQEHQVE
jgi:hypothetical protein